MSAFMAHPDAAFPCFMSMHTEYFHSSKLNISTNGNRYYIIQCIRYEAFIDFCKAATLLFYSSLKLEAINKKQLPVVEFLLLEM